MSPEIRINGKLIADVSDETGNYETLDGNVVMLSMEGIEARNKRQVVGIYIPGVSGVGKNRLVRTVGLTQEGKGSSAKIKKGGDGQEPVIDVTLHDRPIRISYRDQVWVPHTRTLAGPNGGGYYREVIRTYHNPRWMRR